MHVARLPVCTVPTAYCTCTSTWYRRFTAQHIKHAFLRGRSIASCVLWLSKLGHALRERFTPLIGRVIWNPNVTSIAGFFIRGFHKGQNTGLTGIFLSHIYMVASSKSLQSVLASGRSLRIDTALHVEGYPASARR